MSAQPSEKSVRRAKKHVKIKKREGKKVLKRSPEEIAATHKRHLDALNLRMSGATYQNIADALGYSNPSAAKAAVDSAIWRAEKDAAKEVVALDLARLDEYQMRSTHALRTNGDLHQIDRLMRIMEMRYRLLGITDETVRSLQQDHGITINNKNMVMNIHAAPETEEEFLRKMMRATGVDPDSEEAQRVLSEHTTPLALPMLEGSANEGIVRSTSDDDDIVEAEIVEEL